MAQKDVCAFPVEDALEMVLMFDARGDIYYGNAAARDKLEYGEKLPGVHISEVFPNTFQMSEDGFETKRPFGEEVFPDVAYRQNRTCFPVELRIVRREGDPGQCICMAIDVLEREFLNREVEQVRQEARQAIKVKSEFVANVTHELRTPVNGILGNVRELLEQDLGEQAERCLNMMERSCQGMYKIMDNILDFSKLEAGKFALENKKFNIRKMMDYIKAAHKKKITEKGLEFFVTISPNIPDFVVGDELRIIQILNNLLSNAQKFTALGKIMVEVIQTASVNDRMELFFIVKDTGIGIDERDKDKLFQSFTQADASISRKYGGTGLGLNICKRLVEMMGGTIEVESEKNRGSTFSFSLWLGTTEEKEELPEEESAPQQRTAHLLAGTGEEYDELRAFGTRANREKTDRILSKLILCVEMENWEKADMFMETIRQLTMEAPGEIRRGVLRLKMAIQKENYEKITEEYGALNGLLQQQEVME